MNFTKKLCLVLSAWMLLCSLSGCVSGGDVDYQGGTVTPNTTASKPASAPASTPAQTTTPTEAPDDGDENLSLGRVEGGVYTNNYAGFSCALSSDWTFYTADELQDLPDNIGDTMSGTELGDAMANYESIIDMMAESVELLTSVNVTYTKLTMTDRLAYAVMSEEQIIDSILAQKDSLIAAYAQAGITVHTIEKVTVTFMGQQRTAMHMEADISGVAYYTLQFSYQHLGSYGVTLTLSSYVEDKTSDLMSLFSKV